MYVYYFIFTCLVPAQAAYLINYRTLVLLSYLSDLFLYCSVKCHTSILAHPHLSVTLKHTIVDLQDTFVQNVFQI